MDLTKEFPRSPYDMLAGLVMLPRTFDKCIATVKGTNGEYHYGCPMDKILLDFLSVNEEEFKKKVEELETEEKVAEWIESLGKSKEEKDKFNNGMRHADGSDNEEKKQWLEEQRKSLNKEASFTFFDNLDADEKRF